METREATDGDIPEIVSLLKLSLGESLMPKSETYWRWKHKENPFGPSPVLVCWQDGELIGVRAFMRWEWINQGHIYRAVRAVDTATHPDHQGKGIFKRLTTALVDQCKRQGVDFVFNTPNTQSKPGYLKMGWIEAGKLPINVSIRKPVAMVRKWVSNLKNQSDNVVDGSIKYYLQHADLKSLLIDDQQQRNGLVTNCSISYLNWRYGEVPVAKYVAVGIESDSSLNGLIIGRIKETRLGRELRITDCFLKKASNGKELMTVLRDREKEWSVDYTTVTGTVSENLRKKINRFHLRASAGPMVTIRSLQMNDLDRLCKFSQWFPTLGDLELF